MKIVFFNRPKVRKFEYKPRYYDVVKEKRKQRKKELGLGGDDENKSAMFKGELQNRWRSDNKADKERTRKRSIIYLVFIAFVIYYIFFTDLIENFVSQFTAV